MRMKMTKNWFKPIPCIITSLMLFGALLNWPNGYYMMLKIVVSIVSIYMVIIAYFWRKKLVILPFIIVAVLFNPIFPISLSRNLWLLIDILSGILFIVSSLVLKQLEQLVPGDISSNHRRKKLLVRFFIPALIVTVFAIFIGRQALFAIYGNERLSGTQQAIPKSTKKISPIEKGKDDWPCWRGQNGGGKSTVIGITKDWTKGLKKLWEVNFLCQGERNVSWSSVAVVGNRLIVPGRDNNNDLVFCLDPQNGELIWIGSYEATTTSSHGPGARATPYIDEERVYTFGRSGDLVCWSLQDGQLLWRKNVEEAGGKEPSWGHSSSPFVYQDKVIVQGGGEALVIAYNKRSGQLIWAQMQGKAGYAAITSIEIESLVKLLVFHGTGLACLDTDDGKLLWSTEWETNYGVNATTPTVSGSFVFITSGYNTGCQAIKVGDTGFETLWSSKVIASQHSDPIIIDGFIYGYSGQSNQNKGQFKCVELETGKEMWSTNQIGWGTTVYVDEHLLCMDVKGNLFLVKPDHNEFKKVTEFRKALGEITDPAWTVPVIANGRLYIRYMQRLICYDLMPK
jgi:outer membrane protein assembly factor BamB